MAVVDCRECGKSVSTEAAACPHCGAPSPAPAAEAQPVSAKGMKPCKACKKNVIASASTCPHCGVKNPGVTAKDMLWGLFGLFIVVGGIAVACTDSDEDKQAAAQERAVSNAACLKDLQCIGDKAVIAAGIKCPREIEKLAKGAVKWTDGTLEPKFSHFRWKDQAKGVVTLLGDKAQFQNGFGAFVNVVYSCDMDMANESRTILAVKAEEGRL